MFYRHNGKKDKRRLLYLVIIFFHKSNYYCNFNLEITRAMFSIFYISMVAVIENVLSSEVVASPKDGKKTYTALIGKRHRI